MNTNQENYIGQGARIRVNENEGLECYAGNEKSSINTPKNFSGPGQYKDSDNFLKNDQDGFYPNDHNNGGVQRSGNTDDDFIINSTNDDNNDDFIINSTDDENFDDEENFNDQESDNDNLNRPRRDIDVDRNQDHLLSDDINRNENL